MAKKQKEVPIYIECTGCGKKIQIPKGVKMFGGATLTMECVCGTKNKVG